MHSGETIQDGAGADLAGTGLAGVELALTGKLAAMTRDDALLHVEAAGGRVVPLPRESTALLVVGQGGAPLGEDGRLTHALRRAHALRDEGADIRIVGEEELLTRLGLDASRTTLSRTYTTGQLARILDVQPSLIRHWVRQGLIQPAREHGRLYFFDFPQVASAKTLVELFEAGVTAARVRRSLGQLAEREAQGDEAAHESDNAARLLGQLEVLEHAGPLFVRAEDGGLAEPSGQRRFEFDVADEPRLRLLPHAEARRLEDWFEIGVRAERDGRFEEAVRAYRSALRADERHPEVHFNLGNALYALGDLHEARDRFERAVELAPDYVEAWNNLGILLGELEHTDEAIGAYRRALSLAPEYPDALYNLAESLVTQGELAEARKLWRAYLDVDPSSPFARIVRERLSRL